MEIYKKIAGILTEKKYGFPLPGVGRPFRTSAGRSPNRFSRSPKFGDLPTPVGREPQGAGGSVTVEFSKVAKISVERLVRLIREGGGRIKLDPKRPNVLVIHTGSIGLREKSEFIRERLASLLI